jgi:glycosyltransferase involved in cell wall biosynthesis
MIKDHPLVSVIIPTYNYEKYIAAALDSVFAQTYRPIEVIVVDDGSTDKSAEIISTYPEVRYFYQSNQGPAIARNVAISNANGEFIAFLDADDQWQPDKLSIQIAYMIDNPDIDMTTTKVLSFLESGTQVPSWFKPERELGETVGLVPSTWVVRKPVFKQVGDFHPDYCASEDTEWLARAKDAQINLVMLPQTLTIRRLHGSNLTWQFISTSSSRMLRIFREAIARKSR